LSTSLYQDLVSQVRGIVELEFGIANETGLILACTDESQVGETSSIVNEAIKSEGQNIRCSGFLIKKVFAKSTLKYIIFAKSDDENDFKCLSLIAVNLLNLKTYYDDKFDRLSFAKNILLGYVSHGDVLLKAKDLHIQYNSPRAVFLIRAENTSDTYTYDIIQELFPNKTKDFIVILNDGDIALVKELKTKGEQAEVEKIANTIIDTLSAELMIKVVVGIGSTAENLSCLKFSLDEARIALEVRTIFEKEKLIASYNNLGIGRLLYHISPDLGRLFLNEIFKGTSLQSLDTETTTTIQKFFENNLNISEASRQLYVHRNTLVYRLDKIQRLTGLDLRKFDDAITFKVATLVKMYLDSIKG
jgi:carbohydrate diacid regulator